MSRLVMNLSVRLLAALLLIGSNVLPVGCSGESRVEKLIHQAEIFARNGSHYNALERLQDALQLRPDDPDLLVRVARTYLQTNQPEEAFAHADRALQLRPGMPEALIVKSQASLISARTLAAAESDTALAPATDRATTQTLETQLETARTLIQQASEAAGSSDSRVQAELIMLEAEVNELSGNQEAAEASYRRVLEQDPAGEVARAQLINLLLRKAGPEAAAEAETLAREGITRTQQAGATQFHRLLARAQIAQGRLEDAYATIEPFLSPDSPNPNLDTFLLAGEVLQRQLSDLEEAESPDEAQLRTLTERMARLGSMMKGLYPNSPSSFLFRAYSYQLQANMEDPIDEIAPGDTLEDLALEHYEEAVRRVGTSRTQAARTLRLRLASLYLQRQDLFEAERVLDDLIKDFPGDFEVRLTLAKLRLDEAQRLENGTDTPAAGDARVQAARIADEAVETLQMLNVSHPDNMEIRVLLAMALPQRAVRVAQGLSGATLVRASDRQREVTDLLNQARALFETVELKRASDRLLLEAEMILNGVVARSALGMEQDAVAEQQRAERLVIQAVESDPENARALVTLMRFALQRQDMFTALGQGERAMALDPALRPQIASLFQRAGLLDRAAGILYDVIEEHPDLPAPRLQLVGIEMDRGNAAKALEMLEVLIAEHDRMPELQIIKSRALMLASQPQRAIETLQAAVAKFPNAPAIPLELVQLHMRTGNFDQAAQLLATAVEMMDRMQQAGGSSAASAAQLATLTATTRMELAATQIIQRRYPEALETLSRIASDAETGNQLHIEKSRLQAVARLGAGDPPGALAALEGLPEIGQPNEATVWVRAIALAAADRREEAVRRIREANLPAGTRDLFLDLLNTASAEMARIGCDLSLSIIFSQREIYAPVLVQLIDRTLSALPDNPYLLSRKGQALTLGKRSDEARGIFERLAELQPRNLQVQLALGRLLLDDARRLERAGNAEQAAEVYGRIESLANRMIETDPQFSDGLNLLAITMQDRRRYAEANDLYRRLIALNSADWTACNNLAWNLSEAGQYDEAARYSEQAVANAPRNASALVGVVDTQGWIELKRGNVDRAVELLEQARAYGPNLTEIRHHLAQAYEQSGRVHDAVNELEQILLVDPGYHAAGEVRAALRRLAPDSARLREAGEATTETGGA